MQQPLSPARRQEYALREAANPDVGAFEGGAPATPVWIAVGIICVFVILYYWLFADPHSVKPGM
jgi:hypothetical protein